MTDVVFALLVSFTLACGLGVVFSRNPVYSAFSLILSFFGLAAVYIAWGATFIGMIQILVYTGAIVVLFVFVVMLLDLAKAPPSASAGWLASLISGTAAWFVALLLLRSLNRGTWTSFKPAQAAVDLKAISKLLFTDYIWPFEVLGVFLLALVVAVHILSRPDETALDEGKQG